MSTLLNQKSNFTALFCGNDPTAMAAIATLSEKGLSIPDDISVIGYDDNVIAAYTSPTLSTMRVPFDEIARSATRYLLNRCYQLDLDDMHEFPVQLIERLSVKNIN